MIDFLLIPGLCDFLWVCYQSSVCGETIEHGPVESTHHCLHTDKYTDIAVRPMEAEVCRIGRSVI